MRPTALFARLNRRRIKSASRHWPGAGPEHGGLRHRVEQWANALVPSPTERKRRRAIHVFEQSALFDRDWYLEHHPDVAERGIDPARHYLIFGWQEGRDPGPGFSTTAYLRANADVAALGVNPLLHFIEHGHAEGRGTLDHGAAPRTALVPSQTFEAAAPCATFPRTRRPAVRWRRHARTAAAANNIVAVDGQFVGEHRDERSRTSLAAAFDLAARLSGLDGATGALDRPQSVTAAATLLDAWYCGQRGLRTRWQPRPGENLVIRAIQFAGAGPSLVGEAPITAPLDVLDAKLDNPYFPILFVFADEDGWIQGWQLLAFPSLCRGGLHYPEFLAERMIGVDALNERLVDRLISVNRVSAVPLIAMFEVDLRGADGTQPLFQADFQHWLARVARLSARPLAQSPSGDLAYLADAVRIEPGSARNDGSLRLTLSSDMVPTLSLITAEVDADGHHLPDMISFIVSSEERSRPSTLIAVPNDLPDDLANDFMPLYPRLDATGGTARSGQLPILAIRMPRPRPLSEAEMLVPIAAPSLALSQSCETLTFIVPTDARSPHELAEALRSLSLQTAIGPLSLLFVGDPPAAALRLAIRLAASVKSVASMTAAAAMTETALVGYLGAGVLLHDRRTVAVLANSLSDPRVASASTVLVSVEQRGKGWTVAPVDAGEFVATEGDMHPELALSIWRATVPVYRPPMAFWITRKAELVRWVAGESTASGRHSCTSLVTASYRPPGLAYKEALKPPVSALAARLEMLIG